jgi:apolipoprotein N-acyltransferase
MKVTGCGDGMLNWLGFFAVVILFGVFTFTLWWLLNLSLNEMGLWGPMLIAPPCLFVTWLIDRRILRACLAPDEDWHEQPK